jgi:antitoxin component of MazEF toxin-antitoxin module
MSMIDADSNELIDFRKLRQSGDSVVVTIPPEILENTDLELGQNLTVALDLESQNVEIRAVKPEDE